MTLKKSFLGNVLENLKRRKTVAVFIFLILFFTYPVNLLMRISSVDNMIYLTGEERLWSLREAVNDCISYNYVLIAIFGLIGIMVGLQAFGYLHKKNKVDLYHSVPVSYTKRFIVICLNSLVMVFIPIILCFLICLAIIGAYGILTAQAAGTVFGILMLGFVFFIGTFAVTSLAVCLTGNSITALLGTIVLLFYEILTRNIVFVFMDRFFETYVYDYSFGSGIMKQPHFSIGYYMYQLVRAASGNYGGRPVRPYSEIQGSFFANYVSNGVSTGLAVVLMSVIILVTIGLAWFCYKKRPGEAAGSSLAFLKTRRPIKYLIMIPAALYGAEFFTMLGGDYKFPYVIGFLITSVIGCMLIEVIYETDIRCALKHVVDIPVIWIAGAVIVGFFAADLTGYDTYMPKKEELNGIALCGNDYYIRDRYVLEKNGTYYPVNSGEYWSVHPITDEEGVDLILDMVRNSIENGNSYEDLKEEAYTSCVIGYVKKSGKTSFRRYVFPVSRFTEVMEFAGSSQEYTRAYFQGIYELGDRITGISLMDISGNYTDLPKEDIEGLLNAYEKDMEKWTLKDLNNKQPIATFNLWSDIEYEMRNYAYFLYDDFDNTISYLEEKDIFYRDYFAKRDIEEIAFYQDLGKDYKEDDAASSPEDEEVDDKESSLGFSYKNKWSISIENKDAVNEIISLGKSYYYKEDGINLYDVPQAVLDPEGYEYFLEIKWRDDLGQYNVDTFFYEQKDSSQVENFIKMYGSMEEQP